MHTFFVHFASAPLAWRHLQLQTSGQTPHPRLTLLCVKTKAIGTRKKSKTVLSLSGPSSKQTEPDKNFPRKVRRSRQSQWGQQPPWALPQHSRVTSDRLVQLPPHWTSRMKAQSSGPTPAVVPARQQLGSRPCHHLRPSPGLVTSVPGYSICDPGPATYTCNTAGAGPPVRPSWESWLWPDPAPAVTAMGGGILSVRLPPSHSASQIIKRKR